MQVDISEINDRSKTHLYGAVPYLRSKSCCFMYIPLESLGNLNFQQFRIDQLKALIGFKP